MTPSSTNLLINLFISGILSFRTAVTSFLMAFTLDTQSITLSDVCSTLYYFYNCMPGYLRTRIIDFLCSTFHCRKRHGDNTDIKFTSSMSSFISTASSSLPKLLVMHNTRFCEHSGLGPHGFDTGR
jgi:hypothetical protein